MKTCLITGGAGFLGSHVVQYLLKNTDWKLVVWDYLSYASKHAWRLKQICAFSTGRITFENLDIADDLDLVFPGPNYIIHLAAETHVDRSIEYPMPFVHSNMVGTARMLERARNWRSLEAFLYFSTDEVFGPARGQTFSEWDRYNSSNPYAATKAGGEELALAWANTYNLPVIVSHCANIFGERQHDEKFVPKLVRQILAGEQVTIHCDAKDVPGSRMYVYAGDVADAIFRLVTKGKHREKYNIPGREVDNETMAKTVALVLEKPLLSAKSYPYADRPGWDFSYRISSQSIQDVGWTLGDFAKQLKLTVESFVPVESKK
jgi:dTDP-glucose 4,6-dehydratase